MTQTWYDNTGLLQKFGVDQATPLKGGEYRTNGETREIEFKLNLTTLTQTETILADSIFFPTGMTIEQIEIYVDEAAATGVAVDLGFIKTDRTTEGDYNGLLAALPTASMTLGAKITYNAGGTYAGALVGAVTTYVGYISASATTATAFTAGKLRIRIKYSKA